MSRPIERVLVQLDAVAENRAAIDTAARLAARAKAPLHAVFVEDEELLHLAGLPVARQVTPGAGAERLTVDDIELQLQAAAGRARHDLEAAARRHGVKSSFEVVRGAWDAALLGASARDLVVTGAATRPVAGHFRVERRWWSSIEVAPGPFLLARHAWSTSGSVVMLLRERGPASGRLLETAAQIAEAAGAPLTVICPPGVVGRRGFEEWIAERLKNHSVRLQVEVAPAEPAALRQRIGELDCRLLAIETGLAEGRADRLREFLQHFACDMLVLR